MIMNQFIGAINLPQYRCSPSTHDIEGGKLIHISNNLLYGEETIDILGHTYLL